MSVLKPPERSPAEIALRQMHRREAEMIWQVWYTHTGFKNAEAVEQYLNAEDCEDFFDEDPAYQRGMRMLVNAGIQEIGTKEFDGVFHGLYGDGGKVMTDEIWNAAHGKFMGNADERTGLKSAIAAMRANAICFAIDNQKSPYLDFARKIALAFGKLMMMYRLGEFESDYLWDEERKRLAIQRELIHDRILEKLDATLPGDTTTAKARRAVDRMRRGWDLEKVIQRHRENHGELFVKLLGLQHGRMPE